MRLLIATPLGMIIEAADVAHVRAEDESGAFGILPGHADFLTTLTVSVITWREGVRERHVAVRGGVLTVRGSTVSVMTREAVGEDTLAALGTAVLIKMREEEESEQTARLVGTRLELAAMRQIQQYLASASGRLYRAPGPAVTRQGGAAAPTRGDTP